jgi:hypothetical protein
MAKTKSKLYRVVGSVTISVSTLVRAENEEDAKDIASDRPMMSLCHQCATGEDAVEWVTSGELDGEVDELYVQEGMKFTSNRVYR